jgi:hypothetical protein
VGVIFCARKMPAYADFYVKQRIVAPHRKTYSPSQNEQKEAPAGRKNRMHCIRMPCACDGNGPVFLLVLRPSEFFDFL